VKRRIQTRPVIAGMVTGVIDPGAPPRSELCWLEIAVREHDSTGPASLVTCAGVWEENFVFSASGCP
jgi:hypothetical protein